MTNQEIIHTPLSSYPVSLSPFSIGSKTTVLGLESTDKKECRVCL